MLGILHDTGEVTGFAPQPGIGELDTLADAVRAAGLPVSLVIDGDPAAVPAAVDVSVYRVVQEALTNVLKHAGPARADVTVSCAEEAVTIEITGDGMGSPVITHRPVGTGWPGCANGPRYSAVNCTRGRGRAAGSPCVPGCR
jgi:hypothetical protein